MATKKKRKLTDAQVKRSHVQAERLKGKPGVDNPFAVATAQVKRGERAGYAKKADQAKKRKRR